MLSHDMSRSQVSGGGEDDISLTAALMTSHSASSQAAETRLGLLAGDAAGSLAAAAAAAAAIAVGPGPEAATRTYKHKTGEYEELDL